VSSNFTLRVPTVKQLIALLAAVFSLFPFTTIVDFGTYTQPYALLMGMAFIPFAFNTRIDLASCIALSWLLFFGAILYFQAIGGESPAGPLKYLVAYLTPFFIVFPAFYLTRYHRTFFCKLVLWSSYLWVIVAVIQIAFDPSFMTILVRSWSAAGEVVVASGRGVMSLAPEPTTFGFHLIILGALHYLLSGNGRVSALIILCSLFLALSSSSLLVLLMAGSIGVAGHIGLKFLGKMLFFGLAAILVVYPLVFSFLELEEMAVFRIIDLLMVAYNNPELILVDASVNTRLGGLFVAIMECIDRMFIPFGLSHFDWLLERDVLLGKYPFMMGLSNSGFPSGYFIQLYQGGFLFIPFLFYMIYKSLSVSLFPSKYRWLILGAIIIPLFQFSFASPTFWLFWGVFLERISKGSNLGEY
jgi:hypothetical protein